MVPDKFKEKYAFWQNDEDNNNSAILCKGCTSCSTPGGCDILVQNNKEKAAAK